MSIVIFGIDPGVTTGLAIIELDTPTIIHPHQHGRLETRQLSYGGSGNASDLVTGDAAWVEQKIARSIAGDIKSYLSDPQAKSDESGSPHNVHVAIEDFIIRQPNKTRDFLSPVRITAGIMQELYGCEDDITIVFQSPSDAKSVITDERLDKWGYKFDTLKDRHAKDAVRHALLLQRKLFEKGL